MQEGDRVIVRSGNGGVRYRKSFALQFRGLEGSKLFIATIAERLVREETPFQVPTENPEKSLWR